MSKRPRLLDLCCRGGGCSFGYHLAGFDVVGVDHEPQPNYPGNGLFAVEGMSFVCADALEYLAECGHCFDVIAGSPPCQGFTQVASLGKARNGTYREHPNLIEPMRKLMQATGKPYIIENVPGAPLIEPVMLCGSMFPPLRVYRHRLFETNWKLSAPAHSPHRDQTPSAGNGVSPKGFISVCGTGGVRGMTEAQILRKWQSAMGINWMNRDEMAQAIPPAYCQWIGERLLKSLTWHGGGRG
jgi:DNA (cytosine-5)-methyltransferase 1